MATILSCTKSMLSLVEAGQRALPAKSAQLLYALEKAIATAENADFNVFTEPLSKIENEYELDQLDKQLAGIDAFITEVTARKEALA